MILFVAEINEFGGCDIKADYENVYHVMPLANCKIIKLFLFIAVLLIAGDHFLHDFALTDHHLLQSLRHPQTQGAPQKDSLLAHRLIQHRRYGLFNGATAHHQICQNFQVSLAGGGAFC